MKTSCNRAYDLNKEAHQIPVMLTSGLKEKLFELLISELNKSLQSAIIAAKSAHALATHEQSKAETQYDTVGLEASFLAEGQSQRVTQLQQEITGWQQLSASPINGDVQPGMLIEITDDEQNLQYFLLGRTSGGLRLQYQEFKVTVITESSPIGQALIDKQLGDEITLTVNGTTRFYEINNLV